MAPFTLARDLDELLSKMDELPIDESVPFAQDFKNLLATKGAGGLWGPQASDRSKLATRLHFAGWSRQALEELGLKPKDVENFRRKFGLVAKGPGRTKSTKGKPPMGQTVDPVEAIRQKIAEAEGTIQEMREVIETAQNRIEECRAELAQHEAALKVYLSEPSSSS